MSTSGELAPGLLLAAPQLGDPNFKKRVVLLGHHDEDGAIGWIVNGESLGTFGEILVSSGIFEDAALSAKSRVREKPVRRGGPVAPVSGWLMYREQDDAGDEDGVVRFSGGLAMTPNVETLREMVAREDERVAALFLGYAGWGPGQLEQEIALGAWLPVPVDLELILRTDPSLVWDAAYNRSIGLSPAAFVSTQRGSA